MKPFLRGGGILLIVLMLLSCNRYDNDFRGDFDEWLNLLENSMNQAVSQNNPEALATRITGDYLNDGTTRQDLINWLSSFYIPATPVPVIEVEERSFQGFQLAYRVYYPDNPAQLDTTIVDNAVLIEGEFYLKGNGRGWISKFSGQFQQIATAGLSSGNTTEIMSYYADDYLNHGRNKDQMAAFWGQFEPGLVQAEITPESPSGFNLVCRVYGTFEGAPYDSTFTDVARQSATGYELIGNQQGGGADPEFVILAESATGRWCPNCPAAAERMHEIMTDNPSRFLYLEYIQDVAEPDNSDIFDWYRDGSDNSMDASLPAVIFSGKHWVRGGLEVDLNQYNTYVSQLLLQEPRANIQLSQVHLDGTLLSGVAHFTHNDTVPIDNLYLRIAVIESDTPHQYYVTPVTIKNGVIAKNRIPVTNLNEALDFTVTLPADHDSDIYLIAWLQTMEPTYNPETCIIYNAVKKSFPVGRTGSISPVR